MKHFSQVLQETIAEQLQAGQDHYLAVITPEQAEAFLVAAARDLAFTHSAFICTGDPDETGTPCGNTHHADGFDACDENGIDCEPDYEMGWTGRYRCNRCGKAYLITVREVAQ